MITIYHTGMEIRVKVSDYVRDKIRALRVNHPGQFTNIACIRANAMKYLPNFFRSGMMALLAHQHVSLTELFCVQEGSAQQDVFPLS